MRRVNRKQCGAIEERTNPRPTVYPNIPRNLSQYSIKIQYRFTDTENRDSLMFFLNSIVLVYYYY